MTIDRAIAPAGLAAAGIAISAPLLGVLAAVALAVELTVDANRKRQK